MGSIADAGRGGTREGEGGTDESGGRMKKRRMKGGGPDYSGFYCFSIVLCSGVSGFQSAMAWHGMAPWLARS